MWCRSAVNRNFLSFPAACRTRSSALGASFRLGVRDAFCCGRFPLASPLPSIPSATGCPVLFGDFSGTTGLSDFPDPFVIGVRPWTSRRVPRQLRPWADLGSPGSHARCLRTCTVSLTARDSGTPRDIGAPDGAFRFSLQRRRPGVSFLRGCIPGPHVPLSTLRRRSCERLRMTRGRCGSLIHIRMTFAFTTPRRFNRRTRRNVMKIKVTSVYVDDQDKALRFYTEVLGFAKKTDFSQGPYRWLTVASPEEPDGTELQLALNSNPAAKAYQQAIFQQRQPAAMFFTDDVKGDYERIKARGAEFTMPPTDVTGSTIAMLNDTCGNLIQLTQLARHSR